MAVSISTFFRSSRNAEPQEPAMPWMFDAQSESVRIAESVLLEERRSYAARGRPVGGLGSLNVELQSGPNLGFTTRGAVPQLLWPEGKGRLVTSHNLERLISLHHGLDGNDKDNLEKFLLAQLRRASQFGDVAYFTFLALHRFGRTIEALQSARTFLAGDKVFGYSNLLATLSAVVSHEHAEMDPNLFPLLVDALAGDEEPDFALREKINVARLEVLDRRRAARGDGRPA
jgi:hypothetical protein